MKIIQITDPHLVPPDQRHAGLDTTARLERALAHVVAHHADADLLVMTGDLADAGAPAAYQTLRALLTGYPIPVQLMLGNHDNRGAFRAVFPDAFDAGAAHLQTTRTLNGHDLIFLDTLEQGHGYGSLDDGRLAWLDQALANAGGRPVVLFMHHPPSALHIPLFADIALREPEPFFDVVQRHGMVRHMVFGHMHMNTSGSLRGIPFSVSRGTAQNIAPEMDADREPTLTAAGPSYQILLIGRQAVVVHQQDHVTDLAD